MAKETVGSVVSVDLDALERSWIKKSLELQAASVKRSMVKEMPGSPVLAFREAEVLAISMIIAKLGG